VRGGLTLQNETNFHLFIVFHVSVLGGLELCLGVESPPKFPMARGLLKNGLTLREQNNGTLRGEVLVLFMYIQSELMNISVGGYVCNQYSNLYTVN